jgi:hypothetical protein
LIVPNTSTNATQAKAVADADTMLVAAGMPTYSALQTRLKRLEDAIGETLRVAGNGQPKQLEDGLAMLRAIL